MFPAELGRQPDPYVRSVLQSATGRDLGDVRVHVGDDHDAQLDDLGVDALTRGREISVRREHDRPGTLGGRALLLHELFHVLQQSALGPVHSGAEQEAEAREVSVALSTRPPLPVRDGDRQYRGGADTPP